MSSVRRANQSRSEVPIDDRLQPRSLAMHVQFLKCLDCQCVPLTRQIPKPRYVLKLDVGCELDANQKLIENAVRLAAADATKSFADVDPGSLFSWCHSWLLRQC
jgi:hypothetical protein